MKSLMIAGFIIVHLISSPIMAEEQNSDGWKAIQHSGDCLSVESQDSLGADTAAQNTNDQRVSQSQEQRPLAEQTYARVRVELKNGNKFKGYKCTFDSVKMTLQQSGEWRTYQMVNVERILTKGRNAQQGAAALGAAGFLTGLLASDFAGANAMGKVRAIMGRPLLMAAGGALLGYLVGGIMDQWEVVYPSPGQ